MKKLIYLGWIMAIVFTKIPYGMVFMFLNAAIFLLLLYIHTKVLKAKSIKSDWTQCFDEFRDKGIGSFVILSMFGVGPLMGLYIIYKFYKYPITKDVTIEEFEEKLASKKIQKDRENKLKKLGIK